MGEEVDEGGSVGVVLGLFGLFELVLDEFEFVGNAEGLSEDVAQVGLEEKLDFGLNGVLIYFKEGIGEQSWVLFEEDLNEVLLGFAYEPHLLLQRRFVDEDGFVAVGLACIFGEVGVRVGFEGGEWFGQREPIWVRTFFLSELLELLDDWLQLLLDLVDAVLGECEFLQPHLQFG